MERSPAEESINPMMLPVVSAELWTGTCAEAELRGLGRVAGKGHQHRQSDYLGAGKRRLFCGSLISLNLQL